MNCDIAPEIRTLYGSQLCLRFDLARIQLALALSNTVHGVPVQGLYTIIYSLSQACGYWYIFGILHNIVHTLRYINNNKYFSHWNNLFFHVGMASR